MRPDRDPPAPAGALDHPLQPRAAAVALLLALALPFVANALGQDYYVSVATRVLIFALAASSLNLLIGFGGLVSFGHAAYLGAGGYTAAVLINAGVGAAWVVWPAAAAVAALLAGAIGAVCLRTRGVHFIMITLAFAQMLHYAVVSLKAWGGDDGLPLPARPALGAGLVPDETAFYLAVLALVGGLHYALVRLVNARFGHLLQAARDDPTRVAALGASPHRLQWTAFVIAGAVAGLAGALLATHNGLVGPGMLHWSQSGALMIMVIVGGVGHVYGGLVGAVVLLLLEEVASSYTIHWQLAVGVILLAVVLRAPRGLAALAARLAPGRAPDRGGAR